MEPVTAEAAPTVRVPERKPHDRDRRPDVVALLKQAGATASPPPNVAPPPAAGASAAIEALRGELRARDELIASLLARVEQLEQHVLLNSNQLDQVVAGAEPSRGAHDPSSIRSIAPPPSTQQLAQARRTRDDAASQAPPEPRAAPGQFEVEEEAIDRALERTLVQEGVLLLPVGRAEIEPSFSFTRREATAPTFVTQNGTFFAGEQKLRRNEFVSRTALRFGLPFDSQLEVDIPYRYVDQSTVTQVGFEPRDSSDRWGSGLGDIRIGAAKTLLRENGGWWPDLVGRVFWDTDTGKRTDNGVALGGGFNEVDGSLSMVKRQDPLAFVGGVSYAKTFERDSIEPGDEVGFSLGTVLAASPETSLSFFFNQTFADDAKIDGNTINGSDRVIGSVGIGAATILGRNVLLNITGDIGLTDDAPDYAIGASMPIRFDLPVY